MGCNYRPLGLAMGALLLASCAGKDVETVAPTQEEPLAKQDSASDIVTTGSRIKVGNLEAESQFRLGVVAPAPPPPAVAMRSPEIWSPPYHDVGRDKFTDFAENAFKIVREAPVSTFSIDVDTASYSWVRASLNQNVLPQPAAVRTEEMVNYFHYDYTPPKSTAEPFSTNVAVFPSPWSDGRKIVRIGIKGYSVHRATRPRANLVFLIDTSGSMNEPNKLPLVQKSLNMLLDELDERDTVAIVTYAGSAGTALEPTPASQKARIRAVIDSLGAGGSTAGASR